MHEFQFESGVVKEKISLLNWEVILRAKDSTDSKE